MAKTLHDPSTSNLQATLTGLKLAGLESGHSQKYAVELLTKHGPNSLQLKDRWHWLRTIIEPFASWFVFILMLAALISFWIGKSIEGIVVIIILLINAAIYYAQNYSTNKLLKTLEKQQQQFARVRRDGKVIKIPARDLVLGDIVVITEGDKMPADGRVAISNNLSIDESSLTGESEHQHKKNIKLPSKKPIYDQVNMVFSGTIVGSGDGEFIVTATGKDTEFGRIAKLSKPKEEKSPLQTKIDRLTKQLILFVVVIAAATFVLKLARGSEILESIRFVLSLTVSAIPEGLPIAVVVIMVVGVKNMAKHNAIVRKLSAVETLGQVTLIATDKTGTITENQLHVAGSWVPGKNTNFEKVAASSANPKGLDTLDKVIYDRFKPVALSSHIQQTIPFDQSLRLSGMVRKDQNHIITYIKGAPEAIVKASNLTKTQIAAIHTKLKKFSASGFRVLGVAAKTGNHNPLTTKNLQGYSFAGLISFSDTIRPEVKNSVASAKRGGIDIILVSGDHRETVGYFAKLSGISETQNAIEGSEIADMDHAEIRHTLSTTKALGRVLPEHKYLILEALHRTHITAMTGDGINDVPALTRANVGIAVGSGTDAAKQAADLIIVDNNFATIVKAIIQGRATVTNVRRMLTYVLSTNLGEIFAIVGALIVGLPLPFSALQILWINVVTDSFTMIPIGLQKPETNVIKQPPYHPSAPLLGRKRKIRMVLMSIIIAALTLGLYFFYLPFGEASARALAFMVLVTTQWANAFNALSDNRSFVYSLIKPNWWLVGSIVIAIILQIILMFSPISLIFDTQALNTNQILISVGVFIFILLSGDILKKLFPIKNEG